MAVLLPPLGTSSYHCRPSFLPRLPPSSPSSLRLGSPMPERRSKPCKGRGAPRKWPPCRSVGEGDGADGGEDKDEGEEEEPSEEQWYWEQAEGRNKLDEIEDMRELIAEAEQLQSGAGGGVPSAASADASASVEEEERARRLQEELARRAREQAERRKQAEKMLQLGQRAYGRGMYDKSVDLFEAALTNVLGSSNLGGEIQIWLAMAYEAHNRHTDCINLYKSLEKSHPNKAIRRQAKDLRYILEAPKLKISKEEMVTIPLLDQYNQSDSRTWSQMYKDRKSKTTASSKVPPTRDYLADWLIWTPPRWERSPYFWIALTVWLTLVGVSLMFQN